MQFFEEQRKAKVNTKKLVAYFIMAIIGMCITISLVVHLLFQYMLNSEGNIDPIQTPLEFILGANIVTLIVIIGGSLYKTSQLRQGGPAVAESMGAVNALLLRKDPLVKRYLNVVEEMAIASGTPIPDAYVIENESGINAFAAGYDLDHAVVAVTRGCLEKLTRDELQGVVAHEFSHILNGDMRINIKLIGVLHGILIISLLGELMLRSMGRSRSSSKDSGQGKLVILAIGLTLLIIGYLGFFVGRLIKAAVSRQREFLADASAVQFTRNPHGIGGALLRIRGNTEHGILDNNKAEEMSHMFFDSAVKFNFFSGMLATHPSLEKRIANIDPNLFKMKLPEVNNSKPQKKKTEISEEADHPINKKIGSIDPKDLMVAQTILTAMGVEAPEAKDEPQSETLDLDSLLELAEIRLYLILDKFDENSNNIDFAFKDFSEELVNQCKKQIEPLESIAEMLTLVEVCLRDLRMAEDSRKTKIIKVIKALIMRDQKIRSLELCIYVLVHNSFRPSDDQFNKGQKSLKGSKSSIALVLHFLSLESENPKLAFEKASQEIYGEVINHPGEGLLIFDYLFDAFQRLAKLDPQGKEKLLEGLMSCVYADEEVKEEEIELVRVVLKSLQIPAPIQYSHHFQTKEN